MPSAPPDGDPVPPSGPLTLAALDDLRSRPRPFGWYIHVPFCTVRCGYCDFNTYTAAELGTGAGRAEWAGTAITEIRRAVAQLDGAAPPAASIFFGGGTPSLLPPADIGGVIETISAEFGLSADCEITMEANPDTLTRETLDGYRAAGVSRLSLGMQSAVPHVLAVLQRTHDPDAVPGVVEDARAAGFDRISVDLIYATPGESLADWRASLETAIGLNPDHISAYCLGIEEGTALHARVRRGELPAVDEDHAAACYTLADDHLGAAGLAWYEISNWARPGQECRHNLGYWTGADWWAIGPGAHGHVRGVRWWNRRHPAAWAAALSSGSVAAAAREVLDGRQRRDEEVMLGLRLAGGLPRARVLEISGEGPLEEERERGLLTIGADDRVRLTLAGRLMADAVVLRLLTARGQ